MQKSFIALFLMFLLFFDFQAEAQNRQNRLGDRNFEQFQFSRALNNYNRALKRDPGNAHATKRIADIHRLTNNYEEAVKWYAKAVELEDVEPEYIFHYAQALRTQERYEEAKKYYGKYVELNPFDRRARILYGGMDKVLEIAADSMNYKIIEIPINSSASQFSPAFYKENKLVFPSSRKPPTRRRVDTWTEESFLDLYITTRYKDGGYSEPELLSGKVNQRYHEGPLTFNEDFTEMYFTRNFYEGRRRQLSEDRILKLEIFHAVLEGDEWDVKGQLPFADKEFSFGHPSLTPDGKTMYFSSDKEGGFGRGDIYVMHKNEDGSWGEPENLGEDINSEGEEAFPYIHPDGTLYFASDGRPGLGGLDIFRAVKTDDGWEVSNLGPPINSPFDDFGIIKSEDKEWGYFSSNRPGGKGTDDIYRFERRIDVFLEILVLDRLTERPIENAIVKVIDKESGEEKILETDEEGIAHFHLELDKEYTYEVEKDTYRPFSPKTVSTKEIDTTTTIRKTAHLGRFIAGDIFELENLYYDFDKYNIRPDAAVVLDRVVEILNEYPEIEIRLGSHTDSRGTKAYNQRLSERRAQSAVRYLVERGISRDRLSFRGYGETQTVNRCVEGVWCSEADHQLNRRTEIEIITGMD